MDEAISALEEVAAINKEFQRLYQLALGTLKELDERGRDLRDRLTLLKSQIN